MRASGVPLFNMLWEQEHKGVDTFLQVKHEEKLPKDKDEDRFL